MHREVEYPVPETEGKSAWGQVCGCVVAEELGIAEDEAGAVEVVGVPGDERKDGSDQSDDEREVEAPGTGSGGALPAKQVEEFKEGEGCGRDNRSLFGEDGEREEDGDGEDVGR